MRELRLNDRLPHLWRVGSGMTETLMKLLEIKDFITVEHAERVAGLAIDLGRAVGLPETRVPHIRLLAKFHDIGKIGIADAILGKAGPLSPAEKMEMNRHSEIGYHVAQSMVDLSPIADWILKHHERWDGMGYPLGITGEKIPIECRILAIVDSYDAMTNDRPYRRAMSHQAAIAELKRCAGTQFDPQLVENFIRMG